MEKEKQELSPLEKDLLFGKRDAILAKATEEMLLEGNISLYEGHHPNPDAIYAQKMLNLTIKLCQKYDPQKVEKALLKYAPELF